MRKSLSVFLLCCVSLNVLGNSSFTVRGQSRLQQESGSVIFPSEDESSHFIALDFQTEYEGFRLAATAWSEYEASESEIENDLELSELFYDFSIEQWQISAGKKKIDWGVGYGFRPLDLFSPQNSLALYNAVAPGTWLVSGDIFTEDGVMTTICNESQPNFSIAGKLVNSGFGCGYRYYLYIDNWEVQGVVHYDSKLKTRIGFNALTVVGEALELHGALLWQQQYQTSQFSPAAVSDGSHSNQVEAFDSSSALQALIGINYSTNGGYNFILEYWFDGRSPSDKQWADFLSTAEDQSTLDIENRFTGYPSNSRQQMYSSHNLFRHNLMLYAQKKIGRWKPKITMLFNPVDASLLINPNISYHLDSGHSFELGARNYVGPQSSIYNQLEFDQTHYFELELVF